VCHLTRENVRTIEALSHRERVDIAYTCLRLVAHLGNSNNEQNIDHCSNLIKKWLNDSNSVTIEQLKKAQFEVDSIEPWNSSINTFVNTTAKCAVREIYIPDCYYAVNAISAAYYANSSVDLIIF
jgi:phosphotransferase system IIB component